MTLSNDLLLAFYGDDFTGSTDAMESLTRAGIRTVLFLEPPTEEMLAAFTNLQAVGVAGDSRAMPPEEMERSLPAVFSKLGELGAPLIHYKVCSTFDSSPEIGSIGRAIDIGQDIFSSPFVPILVGAPRLGRYTVFGNHYARSGVDDRTYRLDQHAPMREHPVTPMRESDLRVHLSEQTDRTVSLFDILQLETHDTNAQERFAAVLEREEDAVLFDVLYDGQLSTIGGLMWEHASRDVPLFAVGSSGVEYALTAYWRETGELAEPRDFDPLKAINQLLAVSGSCSPVTEHQIERAIEAGFVEIALDPARLVDPACTREESDAIVGEILEVLSGGSSVIVHTCRGPDDPRREAARQRLEELGFEGLEARLKGGRFIGEALGAILNDVLDDADVQRVAIAGGDTSSCIAELLSIEAVEMIAPAAPGSPLCRVHSKRDDMDGREIVFKGGQMGGRDFFVDMLRGTNGETKGGSR